jgi:hypothetical protein
MGGTIGTSESQLLLRVLGLIQQCSGYDTMVQQEFAVLLERTNLIIAKEIAEMIVHLSIAHALLCLSKKRHTYLI